VKMVLAAIKSLHPQESMPRSARGLAGPPSSGVAIFRQIDEKPTTNNSQGLLNFKRSPTARARYALPVDTPGAVSKSPRKRGRLNRNGNCTLPFPSKASPILIGPLTVCRYFNTTLSRSQLEVAP
jgi:hypothetical protein